MRMGMKHCDTCRCLPARSCAHCGVTFMPRRRDQKYHNYHCAHAAASKAWRDRQREAVRG